MLDILLKNVQGVEMSTEKPLSIYRIDEQQRLEEACLSKTRQASSK